LSGGKFASRVTLAIELERIGGEAAAQGSPEWALAEMVGKA